MSKQSRRDFFKTSALIGAAATGVSTKPAKAGPRNILSDHRMGVLVDTTLCIGCRRCEHACKVAHDMPTEPVETYDDRSVFEELRRPDHTALTVVNQFENEKDPVTPINVKFQCMHCDHPACVSACIVGAFTKEENGTVIWHEGICIGCRYCMVACPFQVPTFEYQKAIEPRILKCDFCIHRTSEGQLPACVASCPMEVMVYGERYELLQLAKARIRKNPDKYKDHVFGEHEVDGTSWLYIGAKDFNSLGFPEVGTEAAPGATEPLQHAIFAYFVPPLSLFALLGGIMWINRKKDELE